MRKNQSVALFIVFNALLGSFAAAKGLSREDELRSDIAVAFEIVSKADRGGVEVGSLVEELNEALRLIEDHQTSSLDLAETKIDAIIASAPSLDAEASSITMLRWMSGAFVLLMLAASAVVVKRYGPKAFWTLWLRAMSDWRVRR